MGCHMGTTELCRWSGVTPGNALVDARGCVDIAARASTPLGLGPGGRRSPVRAAHIPLPPPPCSTQLYLLVRQLSAFT